MHSKTLQLLSPKKAQVSNTILQAGHSGIRILIMQPPTAQRTGCLFLGGGWHLTYPSSSEQFDFTRRGGCILQTASGFIASIRRKSCCSPWAYVWGSGGGVGGGGPGLLTHPGLLSVRSHAGRIQGPTAPPALRLTASAPTPRPCAVRKGDSMRPAAFAGPSSPSDLSPKRTRIDRIVTNNGDVRRRCRTCRPRDLHRRRARLPKLG